MIDFAPNALRMGDVTCHDVQIPGLTAGASQALQRPMTEVVDSVVVHRLKPVPPSCPSQLMWASDPSDGPAVYAKACATILPDPAVRNVQTPVPGLTAGAGCERGAALQPAFSPARQGGVRLMDGLRAIPKASVADAAQRVILNRTQGRRQMSTKQRTPTRRRAGLETRAEID
jgi:hypothetical protein